jgi:ABC-type Fe3+/spermidine/putrescine transport system ATPase subunit
LPEFGKRWRWSSLPQVRLLGISKSFETVKAVQDFSLQVEDGEYITFLGPSGCGKTTVLKMIAGLYGPDSGEIWIGEKLVKNTPPEERNTGYVFQNILLFPHMDVYDNVTYGPRVKAWPPQKSRKLAYEVLALVGLSERAKSRPGELSGGMQQKAAVSRALVSGANLLLLDEPLAALDAKVRIEIRNELRRLVKELGLTAIHVTHDQEEALAISDKIVVMKKGRMVEVGTPREIYLNPKTIFTANFVGESNFLEGKRSSILEGEIEIKGGMKVRVGPKMIPSSERLIVAIRPEHVTVEEGPKEGSNAFHCKVETVRFLGSTVRFELRLNHGILVVAKVPYSSLKRIFGIDQTVTARFNPSDVLIYKYPEEGMEKELALE